MLPKARRLPQREVERLMKEGRPATAGALRARSLPGKGRFAFVVSKKVSGDAVTRNRLRRWASAAARALPCPARDIAVIIGKRYASADALSADLRDLISRAR